MGWEQTGADGVEVFNLDDDLTGRIQPDAEVEYDYLFKGSPSLLRLVSSGMTSVNHNSFNACVPATCMHQEYHIRSHPYCSYTGPLWASLVHMRSIDHRRHRCREVELADPVQPSCPCSRPGHARSLCPKPRHKTGGTPDGN